MTAQSAGLEQRARELLAMWQSKDSESIGHGEYSEGFNAAMLQCAAELSLALAAPAADGWVLVPREPTEAMEYAAVRVWDNSPADPGQLQCASDTYAAMLAAAPQAQGEGA